MTAALESATIPMRPVVSRRSVITGSLALLALAAVLLKATVDVFPDDGVFWVVTPLRIVIAAGLVALLVGGVWPARSGTLLDPAILLLLLAAAASTLLGGEWAAWRGLLTVVAGYYLAVGVRRALPGSWQAIALLGLVAVTVAGTTAMRQSAKGIDTGFCRGALDGSADACVGDAMIRAVGTFANPNLLAAFLVLLLPVAAAGTAALPERSAQLIGSGLVAAGYVAVLLTASRGGILAALAGVAVLVAVRGTVFGSGVRSAGVGSGSGPARVGTAPGTATRQATHRSRRPSAALWAIAGIAVLAAGTLALGIASGFGVRSDVWGAALRLIAQHPLGVGPGRAGALLDATIAGDEPFQHAHNLWLNYAVEAGLPGLVAVLAITVGTVAITVRAVRAGSVAAGACGAGLAGFAVLSLADHPANAQRIALVLWIVLGLVAADSPPVWRLLTRRRAAGDRQTGPVPQPDRQTRTARLAADASGWSAPIPHNGRCAARP